MSLLASVLHTDFPLVALLEESHLFSHLKTKKDWERASVTRATSRGGPGAPGRAGGKGRGQAVRRRKDAGGGRGHGRGRTAEGRGQRGGNDRMRRRKVDDGRGQGDGTKE